MNLGWNLNWSPEYSGWIFGLLCALTAIASILLYRHRTGKMLDHIEEMLDAAMDGSFCEKNFDESRMSALESRFAHYLSASALSSRNVAVERDKIKTLITDISHQTNTSLSNLLLYSELLMEEALPETARADAEALHSQSEKLRFLIHALVSLSRLENGILSLHPRRKKIRPLLQDAVRQFTPKAGEKGLFLKLKDPGNATAVFDPKWTGEALCNLVDNAVKYTCRGGITLSVTSYEMFLRIDVTDTGMGIPEEEQARIFSRFYRSERASDQEGVGIGLYLAREIISGGGGYIRVSSVPDGGSTFSVFLPKE